MEDFCDLSAGSCVASRHMFFPQRSPGVTPD